MAATTVILLLWVNQQFIVQVPAYKGSLVEGVLNTPAHINPLLATDEIGYEADRDLTALIYSGLLRSDGKGGFIPDLAKSYDISPDGLTYTFILKHGLTWHDGKSLTASDVAFTIKTVQDTRTKSPKYSSWDGVQVEQIDDLTIRFTLGKPYTLFLENATLGILPEHIWKTIDFNRFDSNKYNREPIGSGPYKFVSMQTVSKDGDDIPVSYTLSAFKNFALGEPYIQTIKTIFYRNEDELKKALESGSVDAINGVSSATAEELEKRGYRVEHTPLPRVLAVFFNQNQASIFADVSVRKALALVVDKNVIIDKVLGGYGVVLDSPIPPGALGYEPSLPEKSHDDRMTQARALLTKAGWKFDNVKNIWSKKTKTATLTLSFNLATSEAPELKAVADLLQSSWQELGVKVDVNLFSTGDLKETVIRPRKFDALFFGQVVGRDSDLYPFWHSSQRLDPGLNLASYTNPDVDKILSQAQTEQDLAKRAKDYQQANDEIVKDVPAIFLYAPQFLYVVPEKLRGVVLESVSVPAERFLNVYQWFVNTDSVWKIFAPSSGT